jgi:hypothetical protein
VKPSRFEPAQQIPSRFATVQIISIPARYPGQPVLPSRETTEAERRHIASMGATATAWGTAVQTILDAVGGLPSVGSPGLMPPRGGLEKEISTWNRNQPAAEEKQPGGYQAPPINPFYDVGPAPK